MSGIIYWQTQTPGVVLTSVIDPALADLAESRDQQGACANRVVCRRWRPYGVVGWSYSGAGPWQPLETCPLPAAEGKR